MNKKLYSFLFSAVIIAGISFPLLNYSVINKHNTQENIIQSENTDSEIWASEMKTVFDDNGTNDFSGQFIDYFADTKTYYLKSDIDYQDQVMYDKDGVSIISDGIFNGNNHSIKNRYDKTNLEAFLNKNHYFFQKFFLDAEQKKILDKLYLFNNLDNVTIMNLTFDNSPFVVTEAIHYSLFHNVNMINTNISNLNLNLKASGAKNKILEKQNTFTIPLFGFKFGSNVGVENSYFDNFTFSDNHFNLSQIGNENLGFNVTLSLIMFISSENTITSFPMSFKEIEFKN